MLGPEVLALSLPSRRLPPRKYLMGKSSRLLPAGLHPAPSPAWAAWAARVPTTYSCHPASPYLSSPLRRPAHSSVIITTPSTGPTVHSTLLSPIHVPKVVTSAPTIRWTR